MRSECTILGLRQSLEPLLAAAKVLQACTPTAIPNWDGRRSSGPTGTPTESWRVTWLDLRRPDGGKTFRPLALENGSWRSKGIPEPRPLYNLRALREDPDAPVLVVEGEKTSDAVRRLLPSYVPITSMHGAEAPQANDWRPLKGRDVVIWPDNDAKGHQYAGKVAELVRKAGSSRIRIVHLPEGLPPKWDLADPVPHGVDVEKLITDAEPVAFEEKEPDAEVEKYRRQHPLSAGDRLLQWASEISELYCDVEEAYADVWINGYRETLPVRSTGFTRWLRNLYKDRPGKGATKEALAHAKANLDAQAARGGQRRVYLRTATHEGKLYIDLCDHSRRVVEVDSGGWRVLSVAPEVRFRRTKTTRPLPEPARGDPGEGLSTLRRLLNIGELDFVLCVAWLLASLRDTGPYPLLVLTGEQGTAKSAAATIFLSLVDPAHPPKRGLPSNERDAAVAALNRHVLAYDNVSGLPPWLSDTLCRFSTGEGYATRALFTDYEEAVIEASRPVILNGIENPSVRGDLAERSITIRLAPIPDTARRTESELMMAFAEASPVIFGSLLSGLSEGLGRYGNVRIERLPRMADFCKWAVACEGAFWPRAPSWLHTRVPRRLRSRKSWRTHPSARRYASS